MQRRSGKSRGVSSARACPLILQSISFGCFETPCYLLMCLFLLRFQQLCVDFQLQVSILEHKTHIQNRYTYRTYLPQPFVSIPYNNMCINALLIHANIHAKSLMLFLFCRSPRPPRNLPTTTFYADIVRAVPLALPAPPPQQLNMTSELVKIVIEVKKKS